MNQTTDSTTEYQQFLSRRHGAAWARRTAERNAAFLLPHLTPGMRLLDAGCGPGSITSGWRSAWRPAKWWGSTSAPNASNRRVGSRPRAARLGVERAVRGGRRVRVAVRGCEGRCGVRCGVHARCAAHLSDPLAALREVRRLLRPGAVIGISDADHGTGIVWPPSDAIHASFEMAVWRGSTTAGRRTPAACCARCCTTRASSA